MSNLKNRSIVSVLGVLLLSSLAGCANIHGLFGSSVNRQRLKQEQQAKLNRLRLHNLRERYRSANVLQTDLTQPTSKRSYILPDGEHYKGN